MTYYPPNPPPPRKKHFKSQLINYCYITAILYSYCNKNVGSLILFSQDKSKTLAPTLCDSTHIKLVRWVRV